MVDKEYKLPNYIELEIRSARSARVLHPEFFEHVTPKTDKKHRRCLRCRVKFISEHFGKRFCASCVTSNNRSSDRAPADSK